MNDARITAGRRLAADLNAIRIENGVSVKDVMDATRLAENVVEELEASGLVSNVMFNKVYLRSIYRSYARAVGLEEERVLSALDAALGGSYTGGLRMDSVDERRPGSDDSRDDAADPPAPKNDPGAVPVPEDYEAILPSHAVLPDAAPPAGRVVLLPNMRGMWAAGIAALVLVSLIVAAVVWVFSKTEAPQGTDESDGLMNDIPQEMTPPAAPVQVLPDTLRILVTARDEPLDPIRITLDLGQTLPISSAADTIELSIEPFVRFPLWIEMDSTVAFHFFRTAQFEREAEHAVFTIEGHELPLDWIDDEGVYTVHRDSVVALLGRRSDVP